MHVVIEIDEYEYKRVKELVSDGVFDYEGITPHLFKSVVYGTPLPKGHGRLIDADKLHHCECKGNFSECDTCLDDDLCNLVNDAPTIIEADKESNMKTFKEVQMEMDEYLKDCLVPIEEFLNWWDSGCVNSYDGIGDLHDGNEFVTDGFETDIFDYIRDLAPTMTKDEFMKKYPYVAWYNK